MRKASASMARVTQAARAARASARNVPAPWLLVPHYRSPRICPNLTLRYRHTPTLADPLTRNGKRHTSGEDQPRESRSSGRCPHLAKEAHYMGQHVPQTIIRAAIVS